MSSRTDLAETHPLSDSQCDSGVGDLSPGQPIDPSLANELAAGRVVSPRDLADTHHVFDSQMHSGVGDPLPGQPIDPSLASQVAAGRVVSRCTTDLADTQTRPGSQSQTGVGDLLPGQPRQGASANELSAGRDYSELRIWAAMLYDAQQARIRVTNRVSSGTVDADIFAATVEHLEQSEHLIALEMRRCYRRTVGRHVRAWQNNSPGIGEHLLARLLGDTGDPAVAEPYHWEGEGADRVLIADPPHLRSLRQWWSYCGRGDASRRKSKGMTAQEAAALGRPAPKMLTRLLSESCVKARRHGSVYADVYDDAKARYELERRDWSKLHRHNAAHSVAAKEILRDLWAAARLDLADTQPIRDSHYEAGVGDLLPLEAA